jgi:hypothetical protein
MEEKRRINFIYVIIGVFGSVIGIFIGYLLAGVFGLTESMSASDAFFTVLANPFAGYKNNFTPILMLLGFIIFESGYAMFLFTRGKEEVVDEEEYEPDIISLVDIDDMVKKEPSDLELFGNLDKEKSKTDKKEEQYTMDRDFVASEDSKKSSKDSDNNDEMDEKLSFGSEIMDEMLGDHYTLEQMVAMISIKKYMKDVTADVLKRMFPPEMSAEEISSYIEIFYG